MPKAHLVGGDRSDFQGFISLEHTHLVMADLRKRLPKFQTELRRKYPGITLEIENRPPRVRNPIQPGVVMVVVAMLGIRFSWSFVDAVGKQLGQETGKTISKLIRTWVHKLEKEHWTKSLKSPKRKALRK